MNKNKLLLILLLTGWLWHGNAQTEIDYLGISDRTLYIEYAIIRMEVYKKDKLVKYYGMEFYRKDDKIRMEFIEPAVEKGRRMLNEETSLWMYMPRTSKVIKLPLKQAFMGSDASNRDLMRMAFKKDYTIVRDTPVGEGLNELELQANDLSVSYHKMVFTFDKEKQGPVTQAMYSLSGKLIKTIEYVYSPSEDGGFYISEYIIRDEVSKDSVTKLYYSEVKRRLNKPAVFFTLGSIKQ